MTDKKLTRKQREKQRHRQEILQAALRLFSHKGFHNVSMQDIAKESEFAVGSLYNFFNSKESLYLELLGDCYHKVIRQLLDIFDEPVSETQKITKCIRTQINIIRDNREVILLYLSQGGGRTTGTHPELDKIIHKEDDEFCLTLQNTFASGQEKGLFRNDISPWIMAISFIALLDAFAMRIIRNPEKITVEQGLADIEKLFLKAVAE